MEIKSENNLLVIEWHSGRAEVIKLEQLKQLISVGAFHNHDILNLIKNKISQEENKIMAKLDEFKLDDKSTS